MKCRHHLVINVPGSYCGLCLPESFKAHTPVLAVDDEGNVSSCQDYYFLRTIFRGELIPVIELGTGTRTTRVCRYILPRVP